MTAALAAGWVDAVVGGGGLLMLPAMLVAFPSAPVAPLLGTNKLTAIMGTASAAVTYFRGVRPDPRIMWPTAGLALLGAGGGAALAGSVSSAALRPTVMVVLAVVLVLVIARPAMGAVADPTLLTRRRVVVAVLLAGGGVGFYDGLIGPGTGTFLIMVLTTVVGLDFVRASASAKVVNTATNLGALAVFAWNGDVLWLLGLGLAVCNVAGAQIGARMALRRGSGFVRGVLVVVVLALLVRLAWEQFA
ncbi:TSUP family transporter [Streptomonospora wellingtoniae]|uniref:Probable membrane transporter protein n=1 Tax=Streptomonospora wellingtoniae TaxID=3075544 RepID=A0ABU2L1M5_9ACTN|nr:TSUP family transporter [Streptomonospora sp. DSM 45055]MDT0305287.1 TSUP family transporter [Streptomonospora sp. DSM 45055]